MKTEMNNKKTTQAQAPKPPVQPGQLMYESGIIYFSDHFDSTTTKPVINMIIEKNLLPQKERPKEITLVINSPGGQVHSAFACDQIRLT